jgi:hypothetical protein
MKVFGWTFIIFSILFLAISLAWANFFLDGLAPGMTVTTGMAAVIGTIKEAFPNIIFSGLTFIVGLILVIRSRKTKNDNAFDL